MSKIIRPPFIIVVIGLILSLTALVLIARSGSVAVGWFAFADYLDCSVDYLLGRTDNPNSHKEAL